MFIQVVTAKVLDEEALWRQVDRWNRELRPGAVGFLGSTGGVTDAGQVLMLARFESEEAARRNSERPEQAAWWAETAQTLEDPRFQDSVGVVVMGGGGSNDAGFVQVMRGRVVDAAKMDDLLARMREFEAALAEMRPDIIGDVTIMHGDGTFTDVIYFHSEVEARANESKEMPEEMQAMFSEWMSVAPIDEYLDLKSPRMV